MPECSVKTSVGTLDRSKVLLPAQKLQPEADPDLAMSSAAAASTTRAGGLEAGAAGAIWGVSAWGGAAPSSWWSWRWRRASRAACWSRRSWNAALSQASPRQQRSVAASRLSNCCSM